MITVSCPSCGSPVKFATQTTGYAVCEACRSVLVRRDLDVEKVGISAAVQEDGSPLQLGAAGTYKGVGFDIVGRIQVRYPSGYWNEWYATFGNGSEGWIGEAQGSYFVNFRVETTDTIPPFVNMRRGVHLVLNQRMYVVTQVQSAHVVGCQGSLPFVQPSGYEAPLVDLRTDTQVGATIDYSENPPLVFIGEYLDFDALKLANLREMEGW